MATDDHGIETIRKAGEEFTPGDKSDYFIKTSLMDSQTKRGAFVLPNGVVNVSEIIRLTGGNFGTVSTLLAHDWRVITTGTGAATVVDGELQLSTGTTANSTVSVDSFRKAPFSAATFNLSHLAFALPGVFNADVIRRLGVYEPNSTPVNGMFFEFLNGNGTDDVELNLVVVKAGVETDRFTEADFNGINKDKLKKDSNIHIYETVYNAGSIFWYQDFQLLHRSSSPTSSAFQSPDLRVGSACININGNTTNNILTTRGKAISRIGVNNSIPRYFHINTTGIFVVKQSSGKLIDIVINDKGSGASSIDVYNNPAAAAGDIIANIDSSDVQGTVTYGCTFDSGLTIETAGGSVNLTVVYE